LHIPPLSLHDALPISNSTAYSDLLAYHYSAYRPPLHALILKRLLAPENSFQTGVDIGCGTGYSARALAPYCEHVYGVDPSQCARDRKSTRLNSSHVSI